MTEYITLVLLHLTYTHVLDQYGRSFDDTRSDNSHLWLLIGFEHIVFGLKFIIAYGIPDVPKKVVMAEQARDFQVNLRSQHFPTTSTTIYCVFGNTV